MTRLTLVTALTALLFGCADQAANERIAKLEERIDKLAQAPTTPGAPSQADEAAAAQLLQGASKAMDKGEAEKAKTAMADLAEKYPGTRAGKAGARMSEEIGVLGKDVVPLTVEKWIQGSEADADGKATLLVFWETWCPHCKREVPKLQGIYDKYNGKGLAVVGMTKMTRGVSEDDVGSFLKDNKVGYPIAKEEGATVSTAYAVRGIPAAVVLKDDKVVWRGHPARINDDMIGRWLGDS